MPDYERWKAYMGMRGYESSNFITVAGRSVLNLYWEEYKDGKTKKNIAF